jgi:hypothetical protein
MDGTFRQWTSLRVHRCFLYVLTPLQWLASMISVPKQPHAFLPILQSHPLPLAMSNLRAWDLQIPLARWWAVLHSPGTPLLLVGLSRGLIFRSIDLPSAMGPRWLPLSHCHSLFTTWGRAAIQIPTRDQFRQTATFVLFILWRVYMRMDTVAGAWKRHKRWPKSLDPGWSGPFGLRTGALSPKDLPLEPLVIVLISQMRAFQPRKPRNSHCGIKGAARGFETRAMWDSWRRCCWWRIRRFWQYRVMPWP